MSGSIRYFGEERSIFYNMYCAVKYYKGKVVRTKLFPTREEAYNYANTKNGTELICAYGLAEWVVPDNFNKNKTI